jgi:hypothetical protein
VVEQEWNDMEKKVSCSLLSCVQWPGHTRD